MSDSLFQRISHSFERQSMMSTLGARLADVSEGSVQITAPILPGARQQQGHAHAALTFAIGDSAAGYSALTMIPEGQEVVTAEIKINLLAPATGDLLVATGRVIKPGRKLIIVTAQVHARVGEQEKLVAILQGTMVPVPV
ncbi:PaaI family thioesterase [Thalassobius sp. S69A]|uniref:PaaI family thioesterase n=1 Tax=unclassified Thalassovita TaxID=2619711 RepID=UPI000C10E5BB|nr:phenylacetic acid degradation protein [Paracoccaceae bacterium]MBA84508.1 phenylacetic acid degradation protein [Paracoccaceae bacterium]MBT27070.1 phenylacetic acid degradation protein [Paracoccaceae bacterium]